ncbi:hypothetical protein G6708_07995 [Polynucleobacter paneuropaeus]|nr:hypothetical protein [Polynucleobacter paneuropaeus]
MLFGIFSLALVSGGADGTWILYAKKLLNGNRLYGDLFVNQQPLFFLFSMLVAKIANNSIFFHKLLYVPILILFIFAIFKIACEVENNNYLRSLLILSIFFVGISFEAFRFDDYHGLSSSLVLLSFYFSLLLFNHKISLNFFTFVQSIICSLTFLTRINEGLSIIFVVLVIIFYISGFSKIFFKNLFKIALIFLFINTILLFLLQENIFTWLNSTIISAASAKGGTDLFIYPIKIYLYSVDRIKSVSYLLLGFICLINFLTFLFSLHFNVGKIKPQKIICFWCFFAFIQILFLRLLYKDFLAAELLPFAVFVSYVSFIVIFSIYFFSSLGIFSKFPPLILLPLYPFALFLFGSLSSGGYYGSFFFPLSICFPIIAFFITYSRALSAKFFLQFFRPFFYTFLFFLAVQCFDIRAHNPYSWHSYRAPSFFGGLNGYMRSYNLSRGFFVLPTNLYNLVYPVCSTLMPGDTLLSLPYSFANYFCGIEPWNGYVQTFFDTSSRTRIERLVHDLDTNPPNYIFYQRQLKSLTSHEDIFNGSRSLPHRALDKLIMDNLSNGKWSLIYQSDLYPPSDWMLIRTSN